jgi:hypothetical protein
MIMIRFEGNMSTSTNGNMNGNHKEIEGEASSINGTNGFNFAMPTTLNTPSSFSNTSLSSTAATSASVAGPPAIVLKGDETAAQLEALALSLTQAKRWSDAADVYSAAMPKAYVSFHMTDCRLPTVQPNDSDAPLRSLQCCRSR